MLDWEKKLPPYPGPHFSHCANAHYQITFLYLFISIPPYLPYIPLGFFGKILKDHHPSSRPGKKFFQPLEGKKGNFP
jgi:hypothetical protein